MDEIRFNRPVPQNIESEMTNQTTKKNRLIGFFKFKKILKILIALIIFAVAVSLIFLGKDLFGNLFKNKNNNYSAVFLSNGQVYFGKMIKNDSSEIVLNNVFYIQVNENGGQAQAQLAQPKFSLVKLGNELHGPTDEIFINRLQVVFYEKLRDDSKVVESIKNYKP